MRLLRRLAIPAVCALLAGSAPAATEPTPWGSVPFTQGLAAPDRTGAGLDRLSAPELDALNAIVAREVALAQAGGVRAFAGTFFSRRTAEERAKTGLDRLSPAEQARLNTLVAAAIAAGPAFAVEAAPRRTALDSVRQLQVHGEVSLTVGSGGHGRSFYDTSLFTTITDPATNITIGLGYEQFHGKGWWGCGYGPLDYLEPDPYAERGFALHR